MPLVSAKCTSCGANLEVDNTKDAAICPYCGTPYIVEKAINNYNTTNNITASVVNVYGGNSADFVIRAGELVKYNGASTDVVIPNSVTIIAGAFDGCTGLVSVTIPDSVTEIMHAFSFCKSLRKVDIPNSVTLIGEYSFWCCSGLKSITIPNSVTSIGKSAFAGCSSLSNIIIPDSITSIGEYAFEDCSSLRSVVIPNSVASIGKCAFKGCSDDLVIIASEKWKQENCYLHSSLKAYIPPPPPPPPSASPRNNTGRTGCYVATAIYGSYDCPSVWVLRRYRDYTLSKSFLGRLFIRFYYAVSPTVVHVFGRKRWFNRIFKKRLDKLVNKLHGAGYDDTPYTDYKY